MTDKYKYVVAIYSDNDDGSMTSQMWPVPDYVVKIVQAQMKDYQCFESFIPSETLDEMEESFKGTYPIIEMNPDQ